VHEQCVPGEHGQEDRKLRGNEAGQITLPDSQKRGWKSGVVHGAKGDAFGNATEQRERTERNDERRNFETGNEEGIQGAAGAAGQQTDARSGCDREVPVPVRGAEEHGRESHHRSHGQIDAAGNENRRQRDGEQPQLHAQPRNLEEVSRGGKVRRDRREQHDLESQRREHRPLAVGRPGEAASRLHGQTCPPTIAV
jgi:hypothetical protein